MTTPDIGARVRAVDGLSDLIAGLLRDGFALSSLTDSDKAMEWALRAYLAGQEAGRAQANSAITWDTTCLGCASRMDALVAETARAEDAERQLAEVTAERDRLADVVLRVRELAARAEGYEFDIVGAQIFDILDGPSPGDVDDDWALSRTCTVSPSPKESPKADGGGVR